MSMEAKPLVLEKSQVQSGSALVYHRIFLRIWSAPLAEGAEHVSLCTLVSQTQYTPKTASSLHLT